jgi:hypothetical protein
VVIQGGKHGFEGAHAETARSAMTAWFKQHLGVEPAAEPAPTGR